MATSLHASSGVIATACLRSSEVKDGTPIESTTDAGNVRNAIRWDVGPAFRASRQATNSSPCHVVSGTIDFEPRDDTHDVDPIVLGNEHQRFYQEKPNAALAPPLLDLFGPLTGHRSGNAGDPFCAAGRAAYAILRFEVSTTSTASQRSSAATTSVPRCYSRSVSGIVVRFLVAVGTILPVS